MRIMAVTIMRMKPSAEYEEYDEDDEYDNCGLFGKQLLNSLYENPFCTNEKKGNLDELLKK